MKNPTITTGRRSIAGWFKTHWQAILLLQLCYYGVILMTLVTFAAYYPANLPDWRFFGTEIALAALLLLNIVGFRTPPARSAKWVELLDWGFLIASALLILGVVWLSGQKDVVYLLSIVCIQASQKRGVWPAGTIFGAGLILVWFGYQRMIGLPILEILGKEAALVVGVIFGLVVVGLLKRANQQTERAESLLMKLQVANRELEAAQQREKELAVAEERVRLARELHDSITQSLYSVTLYAEAAAELIQSGDTRTAEEHLHELRDTAQEALREMRLLIFELRRPALEKSGLAAALRSRLDSVESRGGMQAELLVEGSENLPPAVQAELYNITQEALNNAIRHARARCVQIHLRFEENAAAIEVVDDGVGFDVSNDQQAGGFGISGMKERAQKIGGTLRIDSAPGKGTRVSVWAPAFPTQAPEPSPAVPTSRQVE